MADAELFQFLKRGNPGAFDEIYDRYFIPLLNTSFKRLRSREDALEMVQDVFVQLYMKRAQIEHTHNLPGLLHTLLRNKIIDRFREQLSRQKHYNQLQLLRTGVVEEAPEAIIDGKLLEQKIQAVIERLPEKCREVFLLSRSSHLSHQAIAEKLNISVSTVEKHIVKALKIVREHIDSFSIQSLFILWYIPGGLHSLFFPEA